MWGKQASLVGNYGLERNVQAGGQPHSSSNGSCRTCCSHRSPRSPRSRSAVAPPLRSPAPPPARAQPPRVYQGGQRRNPSNGSSRTCCSHRNARISRTREAPGSRSHQREFHRSRALFLHHLRTTETVALLPVGCHVPAAGRASCAFSARRLVVPGFKGWGPIRRRPRSGRAHVTDCARSRRRARG